MTYTQQSLIDLPWPTSLYLWLYVVSFVAHFAFVSYVVAGALYLLGSTFHRPRRKNSGDQGGTVREVLRDWLPAGLSVAITAGVAPLLFLQILFRRPFYIANLLLFHHWMAVVPLLIVAFYALYLLKSRPAERWCTWSTRAIALTACACLVYVGVAWNRNHLLSLDVASWPSAYAAQSGWRSIRDVLPRGLVWLSMTLPGMATLVSLQARSSLTADDRVRLARIALGGLALAVLACAWYASASRHLRIVTAGEGALPWVILMAVALAIQAVSWERVSSRGQMGSRLRTAAAGGFLLTLLSLACLRESIRIAAFPIRAWFDVHAEAARVGGFAVFLVFAVLNAGAIGLCVYLVRRQIRRPSRGP